MTHAVQVYDALVGLVGGRVYYNAFPQPITGVPPVWPAIRITVVSRVPEEDLCGDGEDEEAEWRVQLDAVAATYAAANALRDSVRAAMAALLVPARLAVSSDEYDTETRTHRVTLDYVLTQSSDAAAYDSPP